MHRHQPLTSQDNGERLRARLESTTRYFRVLNIVVVVVLSSCPRIDGDKTMNKLSTIAHAAKRIVAPAQ